MSKRYRDRTKVVRPIDPDDIVGNHFAIDTTSQDFYALQDGELAVFPADFPIQQERINTAADGYSPMPVPVGSIKDMINYEVGGVRGEVGNTPYSTGVVSSDLVENFDMRGQQAIIRRIPDKNNVGPVGTSDHNMLLALAFAQQTNQYFPNEASQLDLVRSV